MGSLASVPVLDILKVGLSGFCFLLALMGFQLLRAEQRKESPRPLVLGNIRFFMWMSLALGALVAASPFILSKSPAPSEDIDHAGMAYVSDETTYIVDLSQWKPVPKDSAQRVSPVTVIRRDKIRKVKTAHEDYVLPFYTTGLAIDYQPIRDPAPPRFDEVRAPEDNPRLKAYQYTLPIAAEPIEFTAELVNRFIFWNGFRDPREWWASAVKYPTIRVTIVFVFPSSKPCRTIEARLRKGQEKEQLLSDNPPSRTDDGLYAFWSGANLKPETRVYFYFDW